MNDLYQCGQCGALGAGEALHCGRTGALKMAWLPVGWTEIDSGCAPQLFFCAPCTAAEFGGLRAAFSARFAQLGRALLADIALALGVPPMLAERWADEDDTAELQKSEQENVG